MRAIAPGIEYPCDAATTALFKRLRQEHPGLQDLGPRAEDVGHVLNACASILDSLNPIIHHHAWMSRATLRPALPRSDRFCV